MALSQVGLERLNTATTKKIGTSKNLIINGAMQIAQRGTSSTTNGYQTVDRFNMNASGTDESPTQSQVDVNSGDAGDNPFAKGLTKAFRITNGNQTSGAGAADRIRFYQIIEAQNMRHSGWNYTSASSYVTLSFYVKSSVSQNFFLRLTSSDGTGQSYVMETGTLSANTWTRITKKIPGNSNLQFDNDNGQGLFIVFVPFRGTDNTGTRPLNAWATFDAANLYPDMASTWYTTNDATFEITGLQLEVGSVATDFEHRSFAEELRSCYRYFYHTGGDSTDTTYYDDAGGVAQAESTTKAICAVRHPEEMRSTPTVTLVDAVNASGNVTQKGHTHGIPAVANQSGRIGFQRVSATGSPTFQLSGEKPVSFGYIADAEL